MTLVVTLLVSKIVELRQEEAGKEGAESLPAVEVVSLVGERAGCNARAFRVKKK